MKSYLILILFFVSSISCKKSKKDDWRKTFGEGTITINQYIIPTSDAADMDTANHLFMRMRYFIKGNKILRYDEVPETELFTRNDTLSNKKGSITSFLTAKLEHPTYLIYWDSMRAYTFFRQRGKIVASRDSLSNLTSEIFLRSKLNANEQKAKIKELDLKSDKKFIGKRCKKGTGTRANQFITFYYTDNDLPFTSPLNGFFPSLNGDILALACKATTEDQKNTYGDVVFFVESVSEKKLPDYLFEIPPTVAIRDTVFWQEMYDIRLR